MNIKKNGLVLSQNCQPIFFNIMRRGNQLVRYLFCRQVMWVQNPVPYSIFLMGGVLNQLRDSVLQAEDSGCNSHLRLILIITYIFLIAKLNFPKKVFA